MAETPPVTATTPPAAASPPAVTDRRPIPRGVLPRGLQTWIMAGIAVGMLAIMLLVGRPDGRHRRRRWRCGVPGGTSSNEPVLEPAPDGDDSRRASREGVCDKRPRIAGVCGTGWRRAVRSALAGDDAWRTLLQCFRTKLFLATSDELTAKVAAELCGRADHLKPKYTIAETGVGAHISLLSGRAAASQHTIGASKSYTFESDYIFQPRVFMELQNAQAVALPYDGLNPLSPQYCYLKPYYLDVHTSYFDHLARGSL